MLIQLAKQWLSGVGWVVTLLEKSVTTIPAYNWLIWIFLQNALTEGKVSYRSVANMGPWPTKLALQGYQHSFVSTVTLIKNTDTHTHTHQWGRPGMIVTLFASVTITHWILFSNFYTKYPHLFTTNGTNSIPYHRPSELMSNTYSTFVTTYTG